jgi:hypothetical protein
VAVILAHSHSIDLILTLSVDKLLRIAQVAFSQVSCLCLEVRPLCLCSFLQVSDLIQLVKDLHTDNQHLKKTIFDLSSVGFQGSDRLELTKQEEVRRRVLLVAMC